MIEYIYILYRVIANIEITNTSISSRSSHGEMVCVCGENALDLLSPLSSACGKRCTRSSSTGAVQREEVEGTGPGSAPRVSL